MPDFNTGLFLIALIWSFFCVAIGLFIERQIRNKKSKTNTFLKDLIGVNYKKKGD